MYASGPLGKILLVDDDPNIVDLLKFNLSSEGFAISIIPNAKDVTYNDYIDARMVIADAMEQECTGLDLTRTIKSNFDSADIPVIICTSSAGEDRLVESFDAGADDFITKPFSLRELIARIKAVLRRHPMKPRHKNAVSNTNTTVIDVPSLKLHIDTLTQRVVEDGLVVPLTKTEFAILTYLIKNQNSFFSRDEICSEIWKEEAGNNARIVDTNISRLRKKLGETGKYIINRYGQGYAFVDKLS